MRFSHHPAIWTAYPELVAGVLSARGIRADAAAEAAVARYEDIARQRLQAAGSESDLPQVQAWRRVFSRMGLKPTQYRCASESLLRRLRKEGAMSRIHPLIDLCNALSMAFATPVAAFDTAQVHESLQVRLADGTERYLPFGGEIEHPEPGEVVFVDAQGNAHARRWTNRQSGLSAVREGTREVLIVAEAVHAGAAQDMPRLAGAIAGAVHEVWGTTPTTKILSAGDPVFDL
ncbi:B3/B4 domain-containing protein [Ramlibacter sp. AN1133]|uniref:B3/B4 domain-containing protein n=1 Tax=Ramlibacter sp. AN1133 TaxID=3133429 RepID=UPI0030BB987D